MHEIHTDFLNRPDVEALAVADGEILAAVESSLAAQGRGEAVIEPRMQLEPGVSRSVSRSRFGILWAAGALGIGQRLRHA